MQRIEGESKSRHLFLVPQLSISKSMAVCETTCHVLFEGCVVLQAIVDGQREGVCTSVG